ncbi:hypothetical protein TNIN_431091 [Trichonephila inaurata madagascariensis]|uniref:Uncharacterized protein n=1 Tax=Trichonephila inaurata madagascariensis TaxID=2747483 RepID=A0A8X6IDS8_9ARAC|nr:hypothetical protein TNIN_431091 [Trichonephila inaurata madagascariensis]
MRIGHNKEDQFNPEEAKRNNSTASMLRSKEDQAAGIPEAEEVSSNIARREQGERSVTDHTHLKVAAPDDCRSAGFFFLRSEL